MRKIKLFYQHDTFFKTRTIDWMIRVIFSFYPRSVNIQNGFPLKGSPLKSADALLSPIIWTETSPFSIWIITPHALSPCPPIQNIFVNSDRSILHFQVRPLFVGNATICRYLDSFWQILNHKLIQLNNQNMKVKFWLGAPENALALQTDI